MLINELRVGNLVWNDYSGQMTVCAIWANQQPQCVDLVKEKNLPSGRYVIADIKSIPLTEEWLVKLGFDNIGGCYNLSRLKELGHIFGDFAVSKYDDTQMRVWRGDRYIGICHIQYVHQLQNLYWCLCGEELQIQNL